MHIRRGIDRPWIAVATLLALVASGCGDEPTRPLSECTLYGQTPTGATELTGPAGTLESGHRYALDVVAIDPMGSFVLDVTIFTR